MLYLIMIILLLLVGIFAYLLYKSSKKNKNYEKRIDQLIDSNDKTVTVENIKTKIREKYNDQENNINNGSESVILPNDIKEHNHTFRSKCGKGCPLYSES